MATAKEKRIRERLEQIRQRASEINMTHTTTSTFITGADLAEEAAGLGLELLADKEKK